MPRVRFLQSVAGDDIGDRSAGDIADLTAAQARVWADGSRAELVRDEPVERATPQAGKKPGRTR